MLYAASPPCEPAVCDARSLPAPFRVLQRSLRIADRRTPAILSVLPAGSSRASTPHRSIFCRLTRVFPPARHRFQPCPGPKPRREPWHWRRKCAFPQFPFQISHIRGEASLLLSLSRLSSPEARRCPPHWRRAMPWTQAKPVRACRSCLHHRPQFPAFATLQRSRAFHLQ